MPSKSPPKRPGRAPFKPSDFFARNSIFRLDEFLEAHAEAGRSRATSTAVLSYHVARGHLRNLRRGLYATAYGTLDPWVMASKLTADAVVAYDGALSFHGLTPPGPHVSILSRERFSPFEWGKVAFRCVRAPKPVSNDWSVLATERAGQKLLVTSRERALVDCLDRLDLGPGPHRLWELFDTHRALDFEELTSHAHRLGRGLTCSRLGCFLELLGYGGEPLVRSLERARSKSPAYFDRRHRKEQHLFMSRWNLMVPLSIARQPQ